MRKYVATMAQLMCLDDVEYEWLSRHLSHSVDVHKEVYRLHLDHIELAKISKILVATSCGVAANFAGKRLCELTLDGKIYIFKFSLVSILKIVVLLFADIPVPDDLKLTVAAEEEQPYYSENASRKRTTTCHSQPEQKNSQKRARSDEKNYEKQIIDGPSRFGRQRHGVKKYF